MLLRSSPPAEAGFALPLAITGALLLLLSSLSLQALMLHTRSLPALEHKQRQAEDQLASAAQRWAAELQGRLACLQPLPSAMWQQVVLSAGCTVPADLEALRKLQVGGAAVELVDWHPQTGGGSLLLQLADGALKRRYWLGALGVKELG